MWAGEHWGGVLNENEYRWDHSDGVQCGGESDLRRVCGSMVSHDTNVWHSHHH